MVSLNRIFDKFNRQTGAGNRMNDLQKRIIEVLSRYKHAKADVVGSSSGKGIQESGYILPYLLILSNHVKLIYPGCIKYMVLAHYPSIAHVLYQLKLNTHSDRDLTGLVLGPGKSRCNNYRPLSVDKEGYVFTRICHSVNEQGADKCIMEYVTYGGGGVVRILLECIFFKFDIHNAHIL